MQRRLSVLYMRKRSDARASIRERHRQFSSPAIMDTSSWGRFEDRCLDGSDMVLEGRRSPVYSKRRHFLSPALWIGVLAGRCHNRPKGASAIQALYRHGGLTLMEILTPWLLLGLVEGGRT
jgi:hypothetical protein